MRRNLILVALAVVGLVAPSQQQEFEHKFFEDTYSLKWRLEGDKFVFTASAKTAGWVGVGLNEKPFMDDAELMVAGEIKPPTPPPATTTTTTTTPTTTTRTTPPRPSTTTPVTTTTDPTATTTTPTTTTPTTPAATTPEATTPAATTPAATTPAATTPEATTPAATTPAATTPAATTPAATTPAATTPEATTPVATTPAATTPAATTPAATTPEATTPAATTPAATTPEATTPVATTPEATTSAAPTAISLRRSKRQAPGPYSYLRKGDDYSFDDVYEGVAWKFMSASEDVVAGETWTTVVWERKLTTNTEEEEDDSFQLGRGRNIYVLVAYSPSDDIGAHGNARRDFRLVDLFDNNTSDGSTTVTASLAFSLILLVVNLVMM